MNPIDIETLERLAKEAKDDEASPRQTMCFDHGGGRLYIESPRALIADFFDEENRDYYFALSPDVILALLEERKADKAKIADLLENTDSQKQIHDALLTRLREAEKLQDATGFDTHEQALAFIRDAREIDDMARKTCLPPQTEEERLREEKSCDMLRVSFGNIEAKKAHEEILRLRGELTRCREDSSLLDRLQKRGEKSNGMLLEIVCDKFSKKWAVGNDEPTYETLRAAIDAANPEAGR